MAEKRGHTEKLTYDFNTAGVLEIFLRNEKWYRVTSKDFRSFDGRRRITEPTITERYNPNTPMHTYEYEGPVFLWGTNKQVKYNGTGELINSTVREKFNKTSGSRG